jgi:diguanylate cyclase (GGDEF)-like protein
MELDTRSLIVASLMVSALLGAISLLFAGTQRGTRAIGSWGVAMLVLAAGQLGLALRGVIPDLISIAFANTTVVCALVLALGSLRLTRSGVRGDPFGWSLALLLFVLLVIFSELTPNYRVRVVLISAALGVLFVRSALELRRDVPAECRSSYRFTEFVMWAVAAMTLARAASTIVERSADLMVPGVLRSSTFLLYTGFTTAATLGVMWIEIQHLELDLLRSSRIDALTGVLNRGSFLEEFGREVSRSEREGIAFSLAIFDLDLFKRLNDRYGHPVGDRALISVVETMRATIRRHDLLGRYGGEEFALLMPNTGKETAIRVAERIRGEIELGGFRIGGERVGLTVSGGVATFPLDGFDWDSLLITADNALYAAKDAGRNRIVAAGSEAPTATG